MNKINKLIKIKIYYLKTYEFCVTCALGAEGLYMSPEP